MSSINFNIVFYVTNFLEKVQTSLILQQSQQWIKALLAQARQLFHELYDDENIENVKDIMQHIFNWMVEAWEQLQYQYYNVHFNMKAFYQQNNEGTAITIKISKIFVELMLISTEV